MNAFVALQHDAPIALSWAEFIREPYEIKPGFARPGTPERRARQIEPTEAARAWNGFKLHLGRYDDHLARNGRKVLWLGLPIVATRNGELVGAVSSFFLWVHPEHRGRGLAVEMIVERFCYTGVGPGRHFADDRRPRHYTPGGLATLKAAYRELVARGLVDPGPAGLPT